MSARAATRGELAALAGLTRASVRRQTGSCLVEGAVLLGEALDAGLAPRVVVFDAAEGERHVALLERAAAAGAELLVAPAERLVRLADRRHGPPLVAEVPRAVAAAPSVVPATGPALVVLLHGLQDPGNVGTLLRSARAFGASAVLTLPGTADPWAPKVVRSSAGACFHVPTGALADAAAGPDWADAAALEPCRAVTPAEVADVASASVPAPSRCLLVLGHETRGAGGRGRPLCVPQAPGVDSLNVAMAGSILMADWYRAQVR